MAGKTLARNAFYIFIAVQVLLPQYCAGQEPKSNEVFKTAIDNANHVVFLGDSNTHSGEYINVFETAFLLQRSTDAKTPPPTFINLGLSSETCCGLSEPIHPFPRPNVQERLTRVLEKAKPDITFVCYGMNDGIYHPFSKDRFEKFQNGVLKIIAEHAKSRTPLVLLTPPPFDSLPGKKAGKLVDKDAKSFSWKTIYKNYDSEVIQKYAEWMMTLDQPNCLVIDVHTPIKNFLVEARKQDPNFTFSNDGVHFDKHGHTLLGNVILESLGYKKLELPASQNAEGAEASKQQSVLKLVRNRRSVQHLAWLSEVGHLRPGIPAGLPLEKAAATTAAVSKKIEAALKK
jgi:lysophospholipase L1-like esterase